MKSDKDTKEAGTEEFKGYTLDELRYQQALLLIKREFMKEKALKETGKLKNQIPFLNGRSPESSLMSKGIIGKLIGGLSFADYLMLGFQLVRIGRKMGLMFKRK